MTSPAAMADSRFPVMPAIHDGRLFCVFCVLSSLTVIPPVLVVNGYKLKNTGQQYTVKYNNEQCHHVAFLRRASQ
jgi:hypothetical protein